MKRAAVLIVIGLLAAACASTQIMPTPAGSASPPPPGPALSAGAGEDVRTALRRLPSAGALDPGRYAFDNPYTDRDLTHRDCDDGCSSYSRIVVTLPAGWEVSDGLLHKHLGEPNAMALSFWTVGSIYDDPCQWQDSSMSELDLGEIELAPDGAVVLQPSTDGGLLNQVGRNASEPTQVDFGGPQFRQPTIRLELTVPSTLDLAVCDQGEYRTWTEWDVPGSANSHHAPGQIDAVYMVDVDRRPLVIDASHMPATSPEDLAELEAILAALQIE